MKMLLFLVVVTALLAPFVVAWGPLASMSSAQMREIQALALAKAADQPLQARSTVAADSAEAYLEELKNGLHTRDMDPSAIEHQQRLIQATERFIRDTQDSRSAEEESTFGGKTFVRKCPEAVMQSIADSYLYNQLTSPGSWIATNWFDNLHPDVVNGFNGVSGGISSIGKAGYEQILLGVNVDYQNISAIVQAPINYFRKNAIMARFVKTQGSLLLGNKLNVSFNHYLEFTGVSSPPNPATDCKITKLFEYADLSKTREALPDLFGDKIVYLCLSMAELCGDAFPSFGPEIENIPGLTKIGKCYYHWRNTPEIVRDNEQFGDGGIIFLGKNQYCLEANLLILRGRGSTYKPFICPLLGQAVPGVFGCW